MDLRVTRSVVAALRAETERTAPNECCGILLGLGDTIAFAQPARNVAPDPRRHFEIDPQALIDAHRAARAGGSQVLGYYHSHPGGVACPSPVDQAEANRDGSVWAIVGASDVTFWRDGEHGFAPLSYQVEDR